MKQTTKSPSLPKPIAAYFTAAAPCLRSSVPSNEEVVTRNTPCAPFEHSREGFGTV